MMDSKWIAILVAVMGIAAAYAAYTYVVDPTESDVGLDYSDGVYHYSGSFNSAPTMVYVLVKVDNSTIVSDNVYPTDSGNTLSVSAESLMSVTFTLDNNDDVSYIIDFEILDGLDHSIYIYLETMDPEEIQEMTFSLAADGTSESAVLLLTRSSFWGVFVAGIVLVLFVVAALVLYAAGGRR